MKILVAGMDQNINPFTKFVVDYGFKATHVSHLDNKELPKDCRAAIIALQNCGHGLSEKVKREYTGKPIFYAKGGGTSSIKEEFEEHFVKPIINTLQPLTWNNRLYYMLCMFHQPKEKVLYKVFMPKVQKYLGNCTDGNMSNFMRKACDEGVLTKIAGRKGHYQFNGLTRDVLSTLNTVGVNISESFLIDYVPPVEEVVEVTQTEAERLARELEKKGLTNTQEMSALLDMVSNISDSVEGIKKDVGVKLSEMSKKVQSIQQLVNPKGPEAIIDEINQELRRMSYADLIKFKSMMQFWSK